MSLERHSDAEISFLLKMFPYAIQIKYPKGMSEAVAKKAADKIDASMANYSPPVPVRVYDGHIIALFKEEELAKTMFEAIELAIQQEVEKGTIRPGRTWKNARRR